MLIYVTTTVLIDKKFFLFGLTEESRPVYLCVYKHKTYFYVKTKKNHENITARMQNAEKSEIIALLGNYGVEVEDEVEIINMFDAHQFSEHQLPHYKIPLNDFSELAIAKKKLREKGYLISEMPESREKFFSDLKGLPVQWYDIDVDNVIPYNFANTKSKRNPIQFLLTSDALKPVQIDKIPPKAKGVFFDAETFSSRFDKNGSKAMPDSNVEADIMYALSMVFVWSNDPKPISSYCIGVSDGNIAINNGNVIEVPDEQTLYEKFTDMILEEDPDFISGYNIQGYDFLYMCNRTSYMDIKSFGRLIPFEYENDDINIKLDIIELEEYVNTSYEGAGGTWHEYTTPKSYGRVIIDTFELVKPIKASKGTKGALQSHKLNDVGNFFVKDVKEDISYAETFRSYASGDPNRIAKIYSYCVQDSLLCWKVFHKIAGWVYLREASGMFLQDMNDILITGQTKKIFTVFLRKCEELGFAFYRLDNKVSSKFQGGHVEHPKRGKRTNVICYDFASMYPTAQMAKNICLSTYSKIPPAGCTEDEYEKFEMYIELEQKELPAYYDDYVGLDGEEIDYCKLLNDDEYVKDLFVYNGFNLEYKNEFINMVLADEKDFKPIVKTAKLIAYFVKSSKREGVFPTILKTLRASRNGFKKEMKTAEKNGDDALVEIFDQRQKLVKVVMNSIYGILGSPRSPLSCQEASATITHVGRTYIKQVGQYLIDKGCTIVYGDTDSVMFQIPNYEEKLFSNGVDLEVLEWGKAHVDQINATLPKPMEIEFEKVSHNVFLEKKRYIGKMVWPKEENYAKGVISARGDGFPYLRNLFSETVTDITEDKTEEEIVRTVENKLKKLLSGDVSVELLEVHKLLAHSYACASAPMNVYSKYLRSVGEIAEPGTKIPLVVVKPPEGAAVKSKSHYYRLPTTSDPIDYASYYETALKPLRQLINAAFNKVVL